MMRPALTPEARENQLIALATDLAEQQLRDGNSFFTGYYPLFENWGQQKSVSKKKFLKSRKNLSKPRLKT